MKRIYQNHLIMQYPEMFIKDWSKPSLLQRIKDYRYTIIGKQPPFDPSIEKFTFRCEDGWRGLLSQLISCVKYLDSKSGKITRIETVKEKFGGLRIYPKGSVTDEVWTLISEYMKKSYQVCEFTGAKFDVGMWHYGYFRTMSRKYALEYYHQKTQDGTLPPGITFEDCWALHIDNMDVETKRKTL